MSRSKATDRLRKKAWRATLKMNYAKKINYEKK